MIGSDSVGYYHDMIAEMIKWGYQEGTTLFGFGFDFRQSNRYHYIQRFAFSNVEISAIVLFFCIGVLCFMDLSGNLIQSCTLPLILKKFMLLFSDYYDVMKNNVTDIENVKNKN